MYSRRICKYSMGQKNGLHAFYITPPKVNRFGIQMIWIPLARRHWRVARDNLHRGKRTNSDDECRKMATGFSAFFDNKLSRILQIASILMLFGSSSQYQPVYNNTHRAGRFTVPSHKVSTFIAVTVDKSAVLLTSSQKSSPLDMLPAALLRASVDVFAPVLATWQICLLIRTASLWCSRQHKCCHC